MLSARDLHVSYGRTVALHGIDLHVNEGEIVALIGANGAGKSTALRTLSGLLKPVRGSIRFDRQDITGLPAERIVRRGMAHCPEERHVWPAMTVQENLTLGAHTVRGRHKVEERVTLAYQRFPRLQERRRQMAGTLSGGEQQMLAIARALMSEPRLLLLDEPSLGLSPRLVDEVFDVIREINSRGVTVLLVEQNAYHALNLAGRAYVFETGRIAAEKPARELLDDERLLAAYLGG